MSARRYARSMQASATTTMANVDFSGPYRRLVQLFWDPEPQNDENSSDPIWCLGVRYNNPGGPGQTQAKTVKANESAFNSKDHNDLVASDNPSKGSLHNYDPDDGVMVSAPLVAEDRGWPTDFLDDFESRFWFTYRSHFPPIPKSNDAHMASSLTLAVRLRNQLVDQGGFTSDAGFGCMIRSGQCLVANAMATLRLGRGNTCPGQRHPPVEGSNVVLSLAKGDRAG